MSVNALSVAGWNYDVSGTALTLGAGGITSAYPSLQANAPPACPCYFPVIDLPITLSAPQTWSLAGAAGTEGTFQVQGPVTGPTDALGINVSNSASAEVRADVEVGPVTITGTNASDAGVNATANGGVAILYSTGDLNADDGNSISIVDSDLSSYLGGMVGPIFATGGLMTLYAGTTHVNGGVTFDSSSALDMFINSGGTAAGADYAQLSATSSVNLAGSELALSDETFSANGTPICSTLTGGDVDTLVTTTGSLTGTFAGVPDGTIVTINCLGPGGPKASSATINYTTHTVTATVLPSLTVSLAGPGTGSVSGSGIACPGTCSANYSPGTTVTLTAAPVGGSTFGGWSGCDSVAGSTCQVTVNTDTSVTVTLNGPPPPIVATDQATAITDTTATLNGSVDPAGSTLTQCQFNSSAGVVPCVQTVGGGTQPIAVSASVTGLVPGTQYSFSLSATNAGGTQGGQTVAFATLGASGATASTVGTLGTTWPSTTAALYGDVNPHSAVGTTYEFYWGTQMVSPTTVADLGRYQFHSGMASLGNSGAASVRVSAIAPDITPETPYYFTVAAFNSLGDSVGQEQSFEISPPLPQSSGSPYLQQDGDGVPSHGFDLKCVPGGWLNADGPPPYYIRWIYADTGASAPGDVSRTTYPGDTYRVTASDVNHSIACVVSVEDLAGSPVGGPASDPFLVVDPSVAPVAAWMKKALKAYSAVATVNGLVELAIVCAVEGVIPVVGDLACLDEAVWFVAPSYVDVVLSGAGDPPDPHYRDVGLPPLPGAPARLGCPHGTESVRDCGRLLRSAAAYGKATASVGSLFDALSVARNRFLVARASRNPDAELTQTAVRKTLSGLLVRAIQVRQRAATGFARELRRDHMNPEINGHLVRRLARDPIPKLVPASIRRRLVADGFTASEVAKAIRFYATRRASRTLSLLQVILAPLPIAVFARDYDSITLSDVAALVSAMVTQGLLRPAAASQLFSNIDLARAGCHPLAGRAVALATLLAHAKVALPRPFYNFFATAVAPLSPPRAVSVAGWR